MQCLQCSHPVDPYRSMHIHHDVDPEQVACLTCFGRRGFHKNDCAELAVVVTDSCSKCQGSGTVFNGRTCFGCVGKGHLTLGDVQRNFLYAKQCAQNRARLQKILADRKKAAQPSLPFESTGPVEKAV